MQIKKDMCGKIIFLTEMASLRLKPGGAMPFLLIFLLQQRYNRFAINQKMHRERP